MNPRSFLRLTPFGLFLLVFLIGCAPQPSPPPPSSPGPVPVTQTTAPPTAIPAIITHTLTPSPLATRFPDPAGYEWKTIASGLDRPVDIQNAGDGSGRLFVIEQAGRIRILHAGQLSFAPFLDIVDRVDDSGNEQGLLGLAFHPDFGNNGFFYVNYTRQGGDTIIARFSASGDLADPGSEIRLLSVVQPFSNHNGGALAFGPDSYLYIGLGDGGSGGDPRGYAQDPDTLLGKMLRIDVNAGSPYSIPASNPFGNEIWAYGLRNPWRFSFDHLTGDLWIGDVGQNNYEEIDFVRAGTPGGINFGWNRYEGIHDYQAGPHQENHWPPIFEYTHSNTNGGCSVTGGYVYRGAIPEWQGIYFYGDYCSGNVWAALHLVNGNEETWNSEILFQTGLAITSFGVDEASELYLASDNGTILRLSRR